MKIDKELVKEKSNVLFEMKFVKKAKSFTDFVKTVDEFVKPHTLKNSAAKDNVTMGKPNHNLSN